MSVNQLKNLICMYNVFSTVKMQEPKYFLIIRFLIKASSDHHLQSKSLKKYEENTVKIRCVAQNLTNTTIVDIF